MKEYKFYGWENADCKSVSPIFSGNPRELYDALSDIWCAETCAPRLRGNWSRENKTLGQCSITAFLAQDIYGGKVFGIERKTAIFTAITLSESAFSTSQASNSETKGSSTATTPSSCD